MMFDDLHSYWHFILGIAVVYCFKFSLAFWLISLIYVWYQFTESKEVKDEPYEDILEYVLGIGTALIFIK